MMFSLIIVPRDRTRGTHRSFSFAFRLNPAHRFQNLVAPCEFLSTALVAAALLHSAPLLLHRVAFGCFMQPPQRKSSDLAVSFLLKLSVAFWLLCACQRHGHGSASCGRGPRPPRNSSRHLRSVGQPFQREGQAAVPEARPDSPRAFRSRWLAPEDAVTKRERSSLSSRLTPTLFHRRFGFFSSL